MRQAMDKLKVQFVSVILILLLIQLSSATSDDDDDYDDDGKYQAHKESDETRDFQFEDKNGDPFEKELKKLYESWHSEDLCKDVKCKVNERCVVKSKEVAVCEKTSHNIKNSNSNSNNVIVIERPSHKNTDHLNGVDSFDDDLMQFYKEEEEANHCTQCPVVHPQYVCGSNNKTYPSPCNVDYDNCMHHLNIGIECSGFCPCKKLTNKYKNLKKNQAQSKMKNFKKFQKNAYYDKIRKPPKKSKNGFFNDDERQKLKNSVLPVRDKLSKQSKSRCTSEELRSMQERLINWFSVVISDSKRKHLLAKNKKTADIPECPSEVVWMFHHFDTDEDFKLSLKELYYLEHDDKEKCLKTFLNHCDEDEDDYLSPYEWCTCFDHKSKPCSETVRHSKKGLLGAFIPQCDDDGFYLPMQCHSSVGQCWCVDKNGVEFTNTRRKGFPDCKGLLKRARQRTKIHDVDAEDDDDDDDDNENGSGDRIEN